MPRTTVIFDKPTITPPVFVAGSFTKWEAIEMEHSTGDSQQPAYSKTFDIEPGSHQYKFRLGTGDWWLCDDSVDQVSDEQGNLNNRLEVAQDGNTSKLWSFATTKFDEERQPESQQAEKTSSPSEKDDLWHKEYVQVSHSLEDTSASTPPKTSTVGNLEGYVYVKPLKSANECADQEASEAVGKQTSNHNHNHVRYALHGDVAHDMKGDLDSGGNLEDTVTTANVKDDGEYKKEGTPPTNDGGGDDDDDEHEHEHEHENGSINVRNGRNYGTLQQAATTPAPVATATTTSTVLVATAAVAAVPTDDSGGTKTRTSFLSYLCCGRHRKTSTVTAAAMGVVLPLLVSWFLSK